MRRSVTFLVSLFGVLLLALFAMAAQTKKTAAASPNAGQKPPCAAQKVIVPFEICPSTGKEPSAAAKGAGIMKAAADGRDPCEPLEKCDKGKKFCSVDFITPLKPITCVENKAKKCWECSGTVQFECQCP